MPHIEPGDIIFFKPAGLLSRLNLLGQSILTRRLARWSHVATCVQGPLVVHATPTHKAWQAGGNRWLALTGAPAAGHASNPGAGQGGVHLELLEREYLSGATVTVMRPWAAAAAAGFADRLQEASTYWLAQQYSFLRIYLTRLTGAAAVAPGQSFCSFLAQQICGRMGADEFGTLDQARGRTLMPGELFDLLNGDPDHWRAVAPASLFGNDNEERLADAIRRTSMPVPALKNLLAQYKATMATLVVVSNARSAQIEHVQAVNRLFGEMNRIRDELARARAQLAPSAAAALAEQVQTAIGPKLAAIVAVAGAGGGEDDDLLFLNHRALVTILLSAKGQWNIDLKDHWKAALGGASLAGPDEDFVDRYIANQSAIVAAIGLRQSGAGPDAPDARWNLPRDLQAASDLIQDDIRRLDACTLADWRMQRSTTRDLLVRMEAIVRTAMASRSADPGVI